MAVEVSKTGIDWVDRQLKEELNNLQDSKFDKDISIKYLKNLNKKSYRDMMAKNSGATVVAIQVLLKELGYNPGKIDGILKSNGRNTSKTMEAIKKFQSDNNLAVDGFPGPNTVNKLLEKLGSGGNGAPQQPSKPQQPRSPETPVQSVELMTVADLKNLDIEKLGKFGKNGFEFTSVKEKSDNKGKYIEVTVKGKKKRIYELGNNKNGVYYEKFKSYDGSWTVIAFWEYKNGLGNGRGMDLYSNGDKYAGESKNGIREGKGIYYYKSGGKYAGEFKNGINEGKGIYYYENGDKYAGEFKNGKREGKGIYYYKSGGKYAGEFKNGKREGKGIYYYSNGNKHMSGEWKDAKLWRGYVYDKDGKTILERWVNGKKEK